MSDVGVTREFNCGINSKWAIL